MYSPSTLILQEIVIQKFLAPVIPSPSDIKQHCLNFIRSNSLCHCFPLILEKDNNFQKVLKTF